MTREEQIMEYANSFKGKGMENEELKDIIKLAIIDGAKWADANPVQPALPSNLDDAVLQFVLERGQMDNGGTWGVGDIGAAFKAGVEWLISRK